jgi:hypothetical protein
MFVLTEPNLYVLNLMILALSVPANVSLINVFAKESRISRGGSQAVAIIMTFILISVFLVNLLNALTSVYFILNYRESAVHIELLRMLFFNMSWCVFNVLLLYIRKQGR